MLTLCTPCNEIILYWPNFQLYFYCSFDCFSVLYCMYLSLCSISNETKVLDLFSTCTLNQCCLLTCSFWLMCYIFKWLILVIYIIIEHSTVSWLALFAQMASKQHLLHPQTGNWCIKTQVVDSSGEKWHGSICSSRNIYIQSEFIKF